MGTFTSLFSFGTVFFFNKLILKNNDKNKKNRSLSLSSINNSDLIFETIFVVVWIGSGFVTLNAKLLKGKM